MRHFNFARQFNHVADVLKFLRQDQSQIYSVVSSVISEANLLDPIAGMFGAVAAGRDLGYRSLRSEYTYVDISFLQLSNTDAFLVVQLSEKMKIQLFSKLVSSLIQQQN